MSNPLVVELNKDKFKELCKKEYISVYNQPWFMDAVCESPNNWDVILCLKGETIVGALTFFIKRKYGQKYITMPYRAQYNGVWIKEYSNQSMRKKVENEKEIMQALLERLEKEVVDRKISFYNQAYSPDITNWIPLYWKGFRQTTRYTYRVDGLTAIDKIESNFSSGKRQNIKKAEKNGIKLKYDLSALEFYTFHKQCLREEGKSIKYSYEVFEQIYQVLYEHKAGRVLYAVDSTGAIVDAMFSGMDEKWGYNWWHAISKESRRIGASDWLVLEMMKYCASLGIDGYDFEGSMLPGAEESYRQFATEQAPYFVIYKNYVKNPILREVINRHFGFN